MRQPPIHNALRDRRRSGFTLAEVMVVIAIIAIASALALPSLGRWSANQRLHDTARTTEATLSFARGEAMRTGNVHLVFFGGDTALAPLVDPSGVTVDVLVVNDGLPGAVNQNCLIDANEAVVGFSLPTQGDVQPAPGLATSKVPSDNGAAAFGSTVTFTDAGGATNAFWVMFRPDGTTRGFSADCSTGPIGSGNGGIYLHNDERDAAIVLTALGGTRVHSWNDDTGAWTN